MPIYLILAYIVFCAVPLGLAIYLFVEQRRVDRLIADFTDVTDAEIDDAS